MCSLRQYIAMGIVWWFVPLLMKKKYKAAYGVVCSKRLLNQAVGKSLRTHNLKSKKGA